MSGVVDKATADALLVKCKKALQEVLGAEGFELSKVSGSYGDSFGLRFSAIPKATNELGLNPNAPQVLDFKRYHQLFNIDESALGVEFAVGRKTYVFQGIAMSRRKYPISVLDGAKSMLLVDEPRVIEAINTAARLRAASTPSTTPPAPGRKR